MAVWLSRLFGKVSRVSKLYDPNRFTRFDFLIVTVCIGCIVLLHGDFSLHRLEMVAGCVIVVGCLAYIPPRLLLLMSLAAAASLFFYFANRMKDWEVIGILIFCATVWLEYVIERMGGLILRRVDEAHEKIDFIKERVRRIEAKQEETASAYDDQIDL